MKQTMATLVEHLFTSNALPLLAMSRSVYMRSRESVIGKRLLTNVSKIGVFLGKYTATNLKIMGMLCGQFLFSPRLLSTKGRNCLLADTAPQITIKYLLAFMSYIILN